MNRIPKDEYITVWVDEPSTDENEQEFEMQLKEVLASKTGVLTQHIKLIDYAEQH